MFDSQSESSRWLRQAQRDVEAARHNHAGGFYETACFMCQQGAEKALKAFLLGRSQEDVFGHSLIELGRRCASVSPTFPDLRREYRRLDRLYIPTRNPDSLPGGTPAEAFDAQDAEQALRDATAILDAVRPHPTPSAQTEEGEPQHERQGGADPSEP